MFRSVLSTAITLIMIAAASTVSAGSYNTEIWQNGKMISIQGNDYVTTVTQVMDDIVVVMVDYGSDGFLDMVQHHETEPNCRPTNSDQERFTSIMERFGR